MTTDSRTAASVASTPARPVDAVLLASFGGPEGPDDVIPFLENVTRGANIPRPRLEQVGHHYHLFGGRSPINDQNRALIQALEQALADAGSPLPVYWGNRFWAPFMVDGLRQLVTDGHRRVRVVTTSAYPSYSGCRAYREDLAAAVASLADELGDAMPDDLQLERVGNYGLDARFIAANAQALDAALRELPGARVVFVTHSIPTAMNAASGPEGNAYLEWHRQVARRVMVAATEARDDSHDLVFCSRSGRPETPWLEPDVSDHLKALADDGITRVVLAPIGFVSDHMEVVYDLDTEARATCDELGIDMVRSATAGTSPEFVAALVERILGADEAHDGGDAAAALQQGCSGGVCPTPCGVATCCENPRGLDLPVLD